MTILPSYNSFKKPVRITSTQLHGTQRNINGNVYPKSKFQTPYVNGVTYSQRADVDGFGETVREKVKSLEDECETKSGEILYLRKQLKQVKSDFENERVQRESEWTEKLIVAQKEIDVVKAELSFRVSNANENLLRFFFGPWFLVKLSVSQNRNVSLAILVLFHGPDVVSHSWHCFTVLMLFHGLVSKFSCCFTVLMLFHGLVSMFSRCFTVLALFHSRDVVSRSCFNVLVLFHSRDVVSRSCFKVFMLFHSLGIVSQS